MSDTPTPIEKSPFVHLHAHSMYSLLDALGDPSDLVERAKELEFDALALTDHAGLYGAIEFYEAATKGGIKPIIGVEANVAPNKLTDKRPRIDEYVSHVTLLAETNEGYQNLLKLVSVSFLEGFYYKARVDKDAMRQYGKGLIALSGCLKGEIPKACQSHDMEKAEQLLAEYQDIFGKENFFIELVHHPESGTQNDVNGRLIELARKTGAPLVATKDVHYILPSDADAQDALQCIHDGKMLSDNNRYSISTLDHSMTSAQEMIEAFADTPDAISNTRLIADRCNVVLELGKNKLPTFPVPDNKTPENYLRELCDAGLNERYANAPSDEAKERLAFELATIERMGFAAYFLIVHDYVNWAKNHGVIVGPGRGSAAGSIVAYALKITNLDPLQYGLLFERFLNPDRISMPDIDTDFDDVKRKDVIEYVSRLYGHDRVAGIITFGTMAARAAVRDVGRVLGWTFQEVDRVAKAIPPPVQGKHIPLEISIKENAELKAIYEDDPRAQQLMDLAIKLEGTTRHASQHACGIVIAPHPLANYAPLQKAQGGDVEQVIQYSLHSTEVSGLLKMDFLGLSNLTVIRESIEIIEAVHGEYVVIDVIPLDDKATYALLGRGETTGVFQFESDGMKKYIRELKPSVFEDLIAMGALYRPGPLGAGLVDSFILRKHGKEKVSYLHPLTENALKSTYGIPVYQEQVMQVSKDMAGFTSGEADTLRKAMGKKNAKLMAEMREKFVSGSLKNGVEKHTAEDIFQQFEEFAAYGFNKSHSACYGMISYQTAYLKAHWPACFMAALLNSDCTNLDRITIEVEECVRMGMVVLPPDVNESFGRFAVVKESVAQAAGGDPASSHKLAQRHARSLEQHSTSAGSPPAALDEKEGKKKPTIRFGLQAIKGLGEDVVEVIIAERKERGPYESLTDFVSRVPGRSINRKSLECLIKSGAMDRFGDRNQLLFNLEAMLEFHKDREREASSGQVNLFAIASTVPSLKLKAAPPANKRDMLGWEKELLGLYVSEHPFHEYSDRLRPILTRIADLPEHKKAKTVRIGGVVVQSKKIVTKNNEAMVFVKLEDLSGGVEVVVFPRTLKETADRWEVDTPLVVAGRPQEKDGEMKVLAETAFEITDQNIDEIISRDNVAWKTPEERAADRPPDAASVTLHVRASLPETVLIHLRKVFDGNIGSHPVFFLIDDFDGQRRIKTSSKIVWNEEVVKKLEELLGRGTVKIT